MNKKDIFKLTLASGLVAISGAKCYHGCYNGAALRIDKGNQNVFTAGPYGKEYLELMQHQPISLGYSAGDWDGLESITITAGETILMESTDIPSNAQSGVSIVTDPELSPGMYDVVLRAIDKKGNMRTDKAQLKITDEIYKKIDE